MSSYRVKAPALARLCGCESHEELVYALRVSGQPFSGEAPSWASTRQDALALREWYERCEVPPAPRVNVAVVSTASRPGPLDTPSKPKALLRVGDATLLTHCLRGVCRAGVRHVVLVLGGPTSDSISRHLAEMKWSEYFQSLRIVDLGAEYESGHAASLLAAGRVLLGPTQTPRPFLLVGVDHVYHHDMLRTLANTPFLENVTRTDGSAGIVLVETEPAIISRMRLSEHSTAVRVVVNDEWVCEIGRDLESYNGIEAGAFVLSTRVFDALRGLARAAPYFTLAEALACFCGAGRPSQLRATMTAGLPWIAVESGEQMVEASLSGSDLFRFAEGPRRVVTGLALAVDVYPESSRLGVFAADDRPTIVELDDAAAENGGLLEEERPAKSEQVASRGGGFAQRKLSSRSLAALLESYEDTPDSTEHAVLVAKTEPGKPTRAALAVFVDDVLVDPDGRPAYPATHVKRRRLEKILPPNDIERVRLRLFTSDETKPKLAVRVERRVPASGWLVLVVACLACASTSAFERSLPDAVTGALRSVWRQSVTTVLLTIVELARTRAVPRTPRRRAGKPTDSLLGAAKTASWLGPFRLVAPRADRDDRSRTSVGVVLAVVVGFAAQNMALCVAFLFVPTAIALTLVNSTPLWLVARSALCTSKPPRPVVVCGALLGLLGAVVLCAAELGSDAPAADTQLVGIVVGLLGGLGGAVYVLAAKKAKAVPPTRLLLLANAGALVVSVLVACVQSRQAFRHIFDPVRGLLGWTAKSNFLVSVFLSIVVDGLGILGILLALRVVDPLVVTVSLQLEPVLAAFLDALVGVGTLASMSLATYLGSLVVLAGCAIVVTANAKSRDDVDATEALEPLKQGRDAKSRPDSQRRRPPAAAPASSSSSSSTPFDRSRPKTYYGGPAPPDRRAACPDARQAPSAFPAYTYAPGSYHQTATFAAAADWSSSRRQPQPAYASVPTNDQPSYQYGGTATTTPLQRPRTPPWFPPPDTQ